MEASESSKTLITKNAEPTSANKENAQPNFQDGTGREQIWKDSTSENNKNNEKEEEETHGTVKSISAEKQPRVSEELSAIKTNPMITISEPVNSPCESESDIKGESGGAGCREQKPKQESRGRCPIYYGIKSYIHDFYCPPDNEILKSGEYIQEDDFQYLVDPGGCGERQRGWPRGWHRAGLWAGVNLMLVGVIALAVGHLTPPRSPVVGQRGDLTVLDRWAVTYNNRLLFCQLAGLVGFTIGTLVVFLILIIWFNYYPGPAPAYCVMAATVFPETFVATPIAGPRHGWTHRIPLTGTIRGVQPTFTLTNEH